MAIITRVKTAVALNNSAKIAPSGFLEAMSLIAGTKGETCPVERAMEYDRTSEIVAIKIHTNTIQPRPGLNQNPRFSVSLIPSVTLRIYPLSHGECTEDWPLLSAINSRLQINLLEWASMLILLKSVSRDRQIRCQQPMRHDILQSFQTKV